MTLAILAISMHARAHTQPEGRTGNTKAAIKLSREADLYLGEFLGYINDGLSPAQWDGINKTDGLGGSALRRTIDEERTPLVEMLTHLVYNLVHGSLHYEKAIALTRPVGYAKVVALLEEHQDLCLPEPEDNGSPIFVSNDELMAWVTGTWHQAYFYNGGGHRRDPKGDAMLKLRPTIGVMRNEVEIGAV